MGQVMKWGLCLAASQALEAVGITAGQIVQTIGKAHASAGTHLEDGVDASGNHYTAAVDLSVHHPKELADEEVHALLEKLGQHGFAAFFRNPGHDHWPADQQKHIHAVYAGCAMKPMLQRQVHDWLHGLNGLASHAHYSFFEPSTLAQTTVRTLFLAHNPCVIG